jgi:hypothetical protein
VLPGTTRALPGIENDEVPAGHKASAAQVKAGSQARLAAADHRDVNALAHVSARQETTSTTLTIARA